MGVIDQLTDLLSEYQADPATYLLIFFLFCVAAAIILPIPIEIFLVIDPAVPFVFKALVMGLGKGTGAMGVYFIGAKIEETILKFAKWRWFNWLLVKSEAFVRRYGYFAMYIIMAIPGMVDTIPLYIFSILNKEGELMTLRGFVIVNILAGTTRAFLIYAIVTWLGWDIFNVATEGLI
jgi:membrane protein YqaA with SNARE-associated domain